MATKEFILRPKRLGSKKSISYVVPIVIIVVLIIAFAAGYFAGAGTSVVTKYQTTTTTSTVSATSAVNPTCVTLGTCPSSFVYIAYGASRNTGFSLNPQNITVVMGHNNTVTWENLDTVTQTLVGANNVFNSGQLAPGQTFAYTFTAVGTYSYSSPTYAWVKGTVTVVASTATTSAIGSNPNDNY